MSDDLAGDHRHQAAIAAVLGPPARLISSSKTRYVEAHPDHLVVFNANVCLGEAKEWWGDLDLTLDEPDLIRLAQLTGEVVSVLYERDGRFANEAAPLLDQAVYSITASGHSRVDHVRAERRVDGVLYQRPSVRHPRFRRPGRPGLWRPWHIAFQQEQGGLRQCHSRLLYLGQRDPGQRSGGLLVLGLHTLTVTTHGGWLEWTWYPSGGKRWAPALAPRLKWRHGRVRPFISLWIAPGLSHELRIGLFLGRADPIWG